MDNNNLEESTVQEEVDNAQQQNETPIDLQQRFEEGAKDVMQRFELTVAKIVILIASIITTLVIGVLAYNALQPTRHKPSTLLTNPHENSILKDR